MNSTFQSLLNLTYRSNLNITRSLFLFCKVLAASWRFGYTSIRLNTKDRRIQRESMEFIRRVEGFCSWRCWFRSFTFNASNLLILATLIKTTGATCNDEQASSCRVAASEHSIDQLPGRGNCIVKQYVQYTHLCTVSNYLPNVDYCCCQQEEKLLCCRYHQDWYHFRCMESEDVLERDTSDPDQLIASMDIPWIVLFPLIICPLFAMAVCIVCWTKCWCYRYEDDSEIWCCSEIDEKKTKARRRRSDLRDRDDEMAAPLTTGLWDSTQASTLQCLGASSLNRLHSSNGIKTYRHSNAYLTMTVQPSSSLMARDVTSCHCLTSPLRNCAPSLLRSTSSPMHPSPSLDQTRCVCTRNAHADRAGEFQTGEFQTGEFQTEVNNLCLLEEVDCSEEADVLLQRVYCACPAHAHRCYVRCSTVIQPAHAQMCGVCSTITRSPPAYDTTTQNQCALSTLA